MSKRWMHSSTPIRHLHILEKAFVRDRLSRPLRPKRRKAKGGRK